MPVLIDFEARSRADLKTVGGRRYWEHPSSEALCVVWYDTRDGSVGVWYPGQAWPHEGRTLAAHNAAAFDRFAAERYGFGAAGWIDTSQLARKAGLPGSLDALGTRWCGVPKDREASAFTKSLSSVRRPKTIPAPVWKTMADDERREHGTQPTLDAAGLERVVRYCASDVAIMAQAWPRLAPWLPVDAAAQALDAVVNDRGICFDVALARRLLECDARCAAAAIRTCAAELGASPEAVAAAARSPAQFCALAGTPDAQADTVAALLDDEHASPAARALATARKALASIARGKLEAGLARVHADGRLRDAMRYYGAHTGRWSSVGMQLHNLPRPAARFEGADVDALADAVLQGADADAETIALLVRATLTASPGCALVAQDFSSVEARATAWAAGDDAAVDVFRSGRDPYKVAAAAIFRVPYDEVTKPQRQIGKVAELACLAGDTLVLTRKGWTAITELEYDAQLWDGNTWVKHCGTIARGVQRTINVRGVRLTPDHLVLSRRWTQAGDMSQHDLDLASARASANLPSSAIVSGCAAACAWLSCSAIAAQHRTKCLITTFTRGDRHAATCARKSRQARPSNAGGSTPTCAQTTSAEDACSTGSQQSCSDAKTRKRVSITTTEAAGFESGRHGSETAQHSCVTFSTSKDGTLHRSSLTERTTQKGTSPVICALSLSAPTWLIGAACKRCSERSIGFEPVFDIAHAGPRNRFTILSDAGPLIVHNCGYGGGPGAFESMARQYKIAPSVLDALDLRAIVNAWRDLHAPIRSLWYACERAFRAAVGGRAQWAGPWEFVPGDDGDGVACFLSSGRPVVYNGARVDARMLHRDKHDALIYEGAGGETADRSLNFCPICWAQLAPKSHACAAHGAVEPEKRVALYGGKLVENAVQAMCRDLMSEAMLRADRAGLRVVLTVHDELVCDVPEAQADAAAEALHATMLELPPWAAGFPIGADGWIGRRYRK